MKKSELNSIYLKYKNKVITKEELLTSIVQFNPERKKENIDFYLYDIKVSNHGYQLFEDKVKISKRKSFRCKESDLKKRIYDCISPMLADIEYCVWDNLDLQELMTHQFMKIVTYISVERAFLENVHLQLLLDGLQVSTTTYELQLYTNKENILLLPHVKKAPVNRAKKTNQLGGNTNYLPDKNIPTPKLEKLLIDLFADKKGIFNIDGGELVTIFRNSLENYQVNFTTLFSYAKKRNVFEKIKVYLIDTLRFNYEEGEFYSDK